VTKVAVAGATGRTGRFVVQELLNRDVSVVAMVRDEGKAKEIFDDPLPRGLEVIKCDLTAEKEIENCEFILVHKCLACFLVFTISHRD
jgi:uncharacterized protein YbjT (DUF2867 family)